MGIRNLKAQNSHNWLFLPNGFSAIASCFNFNFIGLNLLISEPVQHLMMSSLGSQIGLFRSPSGPSVVRISSKHAVAFIIRYLFVHLIKIIYQFMYKIKSCFYMP